MGDDVRRPPFALTEMTLSASLPVRFTLADTLWRPRNALVRNVTLVALGSALLGLSAQAQVPFYPVPMTMQTFAVLVIAMAYGRGLGMATVVAYLFQGAIGLPVFAGGAAGPGVLFGPTGGYLAGFALAALVLGDLARRGWDRRPWSAAAALLVGNALIYVPGLLWLGIVVGWDKPILELGLLPFLPGDALKLALAAVSLPLLWRAIAWRRTRSRD